MHIASSTVVYSVLAVLSLAVAHVQAQLDRTDAFGNVFAIPSGTGGSYSPPFAPGNIVSFPTSNYMKACSNCTKFDKQSSRVTTPIGVSTDKNKLAQWILVDSSSIVPQTYALKNSKTGLFLGRCTTAGCKAISKANPGVYPLVISEQTPSKTSIWALSNSATTADGPYQFLLSGGKGLFLGQAKNKLYSSDSSQTQFALFETSASPIPVNSLAKVFPKANVVINGVHVIFNIYA